MSELEEWSCPTFYVRARSGFKICYVWASSLVRYVILAVSVAKIDFIVSMASLGVK